MMIQIKRKAVDDDFSDLSCYSSPATKIRRLDAEELAPIMEEEESHNSNNNSPCFSTNQPLTTSQLEAENEERAIVLFNPKNTSSNYLSPHSSLSVSPQFLSAFKKGQRDLCSNLLNYPAQQEEEEEEDVSNECLAVVPWVHSHSRLPPPQQLDTMMIIQEEEEAQPQVASMDIEQQEEYNNNTFPLATEFQQWQQQQQQQCMMMKML